MQGDAPRATIVSVADQFGDELRARAERLGRGEDCICLLANVETDYDDDDEPIDPTLEQLRKLPCVITPRPVVPALDGIMAELEMVGCDGPDDPFRMLSTHHSYEGQAILVKHGKALDALLRKEDWPEAYVLGVALLVAAKSETFWFADTDVPEEVTAIVSRLTRQWAKLWRRSNSELGGITDADRGAIKTALKKFKAEVDKRLAGE